MFLKFVFSTIILVFIGQFLFHFFGLLELSVSMAIRFNDPPASVAVRFSEPWRGVLNLPTLSVVWIKSSDHAAQF